MKNSLILEEATIVLKTFRLVADRRVFTEKQAATIRSDKKLSEVRLAKLARETAKLTESFTGKKTLSEQILRESVADFRREIFNEAIKLENLIILEAASNMSVGQMTQQMSGMLSALDPLMTLSQTLASNVEQLAHQARSMATDLEDLEGAGIDREFQLKMKEYTSIFSQIASIVKGLVAVADELTSGKLAEIVGPVMQWMLKRKQKMVSMLETFHMYDLEVKKVGGDAKATGGGFMSRLLKKSSSQVDTASQFKQTFDQIVKSKAPGFAKLSQSFGGEMMEQPMRAVWMTFKAFDDGVANEVDLDFIFNMSKQSFGSALKGLFGGGAYGRTGAGMGGSAPR